MSLIVEDGSARADAESYASVAQFAAYHTARGNTYSLDETGIEQKLRSATDYMAAVYGGRWRGTRVTATQALDWPRAWVELVDAPGYGDYYVPSTVVPTAVINACIELAFRAIAAPLLADLGGIQIKRRKTDVLETEWFEGGVGQTQYVAVDGLLSALLLGGAGIGGGSGTIRLYRA